LCDGRCLELCQTVATTFLFNGFPIFHIREILGWATSTWSPPAVLLETDKCAAKIAHVKNLDYGARLDS